MSPQFDWSQFEVVNDDTSTASIDWSQFSPVSEDEEVYPDQVSRAASRPQVTAPPLQDTEDQVSRATSPRSSDVGYLGEIGRALEHGVKVTAPKAVGQAAEFFGATDTGKRIQEYAKSNENLGNLESAAGQAEGGTFSIRGNVYEAADNAVLSLAPGAAGAAIGATVGSVVPGIGTAVGALAGYAIGSAAALPIFYGSQAQDSYEAVFAEQKKQGKSDAEADIIARRTAHVEGGIEAGGELVADIIPFGKLFKPLAKAGGKAGLDLVKSVFFPSIGKTAAHAAGIVAAETGTEMLQQAGETQARKSIGGTGEGATWEDTSKVIMPTVLMSLIPGMAGAGSKYAQVNKSRAALESPDTDPEARAKIALAAVDAIKEQSPEVAQAFSLYAFERIKDGEAIKIGSDADYSQYQQEAEAAKSQPAEDVYANAPEEPAPVLALPGQGQVAMPMAQPLPVTEEPVVDPAQAHADEVYAARAAEEARQQALRPQTASEIQVDTANPAASIQAIAEAPITQVNEPLAAPSGVAEADHATAAGDLAGMMLSLYNLDRQIKVTQPKARPALQEQADALRAEARQMLADYAGQYGQDAANHLQRTASETYFNMRGDYSSLQRPAAAVQPAAMFTGREQPTGVNNAETVRGNAGQIREGGPEGLPGVQPGAVEGGGNLQQQAPGQPGYRAPEGAANVPQGRGEQLPAGQVARGERRVAGTEAVEGRLVPVTNGHAGAPAPKVTTEVDQAAHEAAASPLNERTPPTPAQAEAGNYKKGEPVSFGGGALRFRTENPSGSIRTDKNLPPKWRSRLVGFHYGYDMGTRAADSTETKKQDVDWLVREGTPQNWNGKVFVMDAIDQRTGKFDEHKWMAGVDSLEEARAGFAAQYPKGWKLGKISQTTLQGYRTWKLTANPKVPFAPQPHTKGVLGSTETEYRRWVEGATDVVWKPNPLKAATKRKTRGSAVSVLREHGVEHTILAPILQRFVDRPELGFERLTPAEQSTLSAAIADAITVHNLPPVVFAATEGGMYTFKAGGDLAVSQFNNGDAGIGVRKNVISAAASGHQGWQGSLVADIVHETFHLIDTLRGVSATTVSPHFEIRDGFAVGDVIVEAETAWREGPPELRRFWEYPFSGDFASDVLQEEIGAQLWLLYNTQPELMKAEHPIAFEIYKDLHEKLSAIDRSGNLFSQASDARNAVRQSLGAQNIEAGKRAGQALPGGRGIRVGNVQTEGRGGGEGKRAVRQPSAHEIEVERDRRSVLDALSAEEKGRFRIKSNAKKFIDIFLQMPSSKEMAAVAWAGKAKKGWYRNAAFALHHVFGLDAPRFTALLAATSPRTSVESNLKAALQTWNAWERMGRPTTHRGIIEALSEGVKGTSVLVSTARNNVIRALSHPRPEEQLISGPKVESFFRNLMGDVYEVTNDGWMAAYAGVNARIFGGPSIPLEQEVTDAGKRVGYMAMNAHVRQAAKMLTRLTGEVWTPSEVQETIWSWAKTLYEKAGVNKSAADIINDKELTDALIAATPDFGSLLTEGTFADILRAGGKAAGIEALSRARRESAGPEIQQQRQEPLREAGPFAGSTQKALEIRAAKRLDALREQRLADEAAGKVVTGIAEGVGEEADITPEQQAGEVAVYDDFREDPEAALRKPGWAIVTATQEGQPDAVNEVANDRLAEELRRDGVESYGVDGFWKGEDQGRSFLIFTNPAYALKLAKKYKQQAITTNKGFEYTNGKVEVADHDRTVVGPEARKQDGYTILPDGTAFSLGFPEQPKTNDTLTPYAGAPDSLMGFRRYGPQREFGEQKYKHVVFVRVTQSNGSHHVDAMAGLNESHAMERARRNWKDATIERISPEEAEREDPGIVVAAEIPKTNATVTPEGDRASVVSSNEMKGDGRGFTEFFTEASLGNRAPDKAVPYVPVLDISGISDFSAEYIRHRGNFDDHIATSIPGFREVQQIVGNAIVRSYPNGANLLDIAASEGAFNKTITALSDGQIKTLALDPNLAMAKFFEEHSNVPGATYEVAAFGPKEDEGKLAWVENEGKPDETKIFTFAPKVKYDIVHEAMGFQFISNTRNAQFARAKEMMTPDGIALFEEKIKDNTPEWKANEAKKDAYKAQYFTPAQLKAKAAEVLEKGAAGAAEAESQREQSVVGMNDLMTTGHELETALTNNWTHVAQYWDAGNFKGYVASDSREALDRFLSNLTDLNSEYSTVKTPRSVAGGKLKVNATHAPATESEAFKTWFGESKVTDANGKPLRLFHGTPTSFESFDMTKMSDDSDWGPGIYLTNSTADASMNYADMGPDLQNKIARATERLFQERNTTPTGGMLYGYTTPEYRKLWGEITKEVKKRMVPTKGIVMPLYVRMENPFVIGGRNETYLDMDYEYDADGEITRETGGLPRFLQSLRTAAEGQYGVDVDAAIANVLSDFPDGARASQLVKALRHYNSMLYAEDENGNYIGPGNIIAAALSEAGYDGIIDREVRKKFGMKGTDADTAHYIAFSPFQVKSASGNIGAFSRENPKVNAVLGSNPLPGNPATWDSPAIGGKFEKLIFELQDKHIDTKKVQQAIKDFGAAVPEREDVYLQEELYHGRSAKESQDFVERELKPLISDMALRKVSLKDFETFLHNRHAEERNRQIARVNPAFPDGGSGITTADARAYLAALTPAQRTAYTALARRVDAIIARTNQILVAERLESPATIAAWNNVYKDYVPLHREDVGDGNLGGTGQGYSTKGSASKRATGSSLPVENIIANLALQREKTITRGAKNRVANALVNLAIANPNNAFWTVDTPTKIKFIGPNGLVQEAVDPMWKSRENVVVARMQTASGDIVERGVTFNPRDERAVRMAKSLKNIDVAEVNAALKAAGMVTRWFASMNTQYNPIFGIVNLVRDAQQSIFNLTTTPIANRKAKVLRDILPALVGVYRDLRSERRGRPARSAWSQLFEEFQKEGGQTGYRDMFVTAEERTKKIEAEIERLGQGKVRRAPLALVHLVGDWLSDYNLAMENATRLAAYREALNAGLSKSRAASVAKNLTVNFNRKGNTSSQMTALFAFFNASAQGTARLLETLNGPRGKQIIAGGVLLGVLQAFALASAGFDDDEPPEFEREKNLIIPLGGKSYFKLPMPLGLHMLPSIGRVPTEMMLRGMRDPGDRIASLFSLIFDAFSPMGGGASVGQIISPTPTDPLVAVLENKDWTGKPIYREDFNSLAPTPGHTRAKDVASPLSVMISKAINAATGGTDYQPGILSPSPDTIDYLAGQVGGGVWREASKAMTTAKAIETGEELPLFKRPLVGRFLGSASGQAPQADTFYKNLIEINKHEAEIKGRTENDEDVEGYIEKHPTAELVEQANDAQREVAKLRKQRREMVAEGADKADVREIEQEITDAMRDFNDLVKETRSGG